MPLGLATYVSPDTWPFAPPSVPYLTTTVQGETADDLRAKVVQMFAEVTLVNAAIAAAFPSNPEILLTATDMTLAGGGDGYTFVFTVTWNPTAINETEILLDSDPALPAAIAVDFSLGTDQRSVQAGIDAMLVRLGSGAFGVWQGSAGASKGTRFMNFIGYFLPAET